MRLKRSSPFELWLRRIAVIKIRQTLLLTKGNREQAARMLGINRVTLFRYLSWDEEREEQSCTSGEPPLEKMSNAAPAGRSYRSEQNIAPHLDLD